MNKIYSIVKWPLMAIGMLIASIAVVMFGIVYFLFLCLAEVLDRIIAAKKGGEAL